MPEIKILSENVRNRIAAGEILERPYSAVKELIENALDAKADNIEIEIADGGSSYIRVTDNGCGMADDDLPLAVLRHATSKINDIADILKISSMGFRGEALPSLAAVSRMEITSRQVGEISGHKLRIDGGEVLQQEPSPHAEGTTVKLRDIFFNTPGRRKFMKSTAAEAAAIKEAIIRLALSYPETSFKFINNNKQVLSLPRDGEVLRRIGSLYGHEMASELRPITSTQGDSLLVSGFLLPPPGHRASTKMIYTFVNRRWISHKSLTFAVRDSFSDSLPGRKYPVVFLFLTLPTEQIDVNAHPTKQDIRFAQERLVLAAVRKSLGATVRSSASGRVLSEPAFTPEVNGGKKTLVRESEIIKDTAANYKSNNVQPLNYSSRPVFNRPFEANSRPKPTFSLPSIALTAKKESEKNSCQGSIFSQSDLPELPDKKILAQFKDCFLLLECREGLLIVDQHAMHERLIYEELLKRSTAVLSQKLLVPEVVELTGAELEVFNELHQELAETGFSVDVFGENSVAIQAVPAVLKHIRVQDVFQQALAELAKGGHGTVNLLEPFLKNLACKAAVKAGDSLAEEEIIALLQRFEQESVPYSCPHGRPFAYLIEESEIKRRFGRK